jgi:hypothetical protein
VLVEAIRQVNILSQNGEPPYLVADIRVPFAPLGFGVRLKSLSNLSAFVSLEV